MAEADRNGSGRSNCGQRKKVTVSYRTLLESEVPAIARVHRHACLIAYAFMDRSYGEDQVHEWYAGKSADRDWGLIAECDGAVAGFVATSGAHLDQLFVDPDHHRGGLGTYLLPAALRPIPPVVTLNVFAANEPARRLYERHSFREVDRFFNRQNRTVGLLLIRNQPVERGVSKAK